MAVCSISIKCCDIIAKRCFDPCQDDVDKRSFVLAFVDDCDPRDAPPASSERYRFYFQCALYIFDFGAPTGLRLALFHLDTFCELVPSRHQ